MQLTISQSDLSKALDRVVRASAAKNAPPICGSVLLDATGDRLRLACTDLEIAITAWLDTEIAEPGTICIPARQLSGFVDSLDGTLTLTTDKADRLTIAAGAARVKLPGLAADDFPPIRDDGEPLPSISGPALRRALTRVLDCAAKDQSRPVLAGALLEFGTTLNLAAADGFRLAVAEIALEEPAEPLAVIVPLRGLRELERALAGYDGDVSIALDPTHAITFATPHVRLRSQVVNGHFPNFRQLIPQAHPTKWVISTAALAQAVARAKLTDSPWFRLRQDGEQIAVSVRSHEDSGNSQFEDRLEARVEGPPARIAVNCRLFAELVAAVDAEECELRLRESGEPLVLRAVGDEGWVGIQMPGFVAWEPGEEARGAFEAEAREEEAVAVV